MNSGFKWGPDPGIMSDMATRKQNPRLGGTRPGAGRKPVLKNPQLRSVTFEKAQIAALSKIAKRRRWTYAEAVRQAVAAFVKREKARN